ncbi:2377_t:CDS:10 [Entrophospora sp. SA101]|nr:2377_t:CDS:10 [Entrophospora sp. SA101]
MVAINEILKKSIIDSIKSVQPAGSWKVVVVDKPSLKIIESVCKTNDILEEKVTSVENIEKKRQPFPQLEAVYILSPTYESISTVIEDFDKPTPTYAAANLFFISALDDKYFQKLKSSPASKYIRKFIELFIDFQVREAQVYTFDDPSSFFKLYSPFSINENTIYEDELRNTAKKLLSVCASLGENPLIRYQRSLEADHPTKSLPYKLAMLLQAELDQYVKTNPNFPPQDNQRPRAVLFVFDRTIDMYSPFLHEFTYQAMANDLLKIENGQKYNYTYVDQDGQPATKDVVLDDNDKVWVEVRHKHMKDCIDKLMKDFNEFLGENSEFTDKDKAANLNDMKKMMATLPQFQNMKEKFSVHLNIAQECMSIFENEILAETATIEQNCATGFTSDGLHPKTLVEEMVPLLDNPVVSSVDRVRMLMLYMMYKNGIFDDDRRKLLAHAGISSQDSEAINNLGLFGVKLVKSPQGNKRKVKKYRQKPGEEIEYEISRYVPRIKLVLESHIDNSIDHTAYPYTKDPTGDPDGSKDTQGPVSLRTARSGWFKRGQATENRNIGRIIVFVAGGVTNSELRSAYEITEKYNRDVIIGSTHVITPKQFIEDLKLLRNQPRRPNQQRSQKPSLPSLGYSQGYQQSYSQQQLPPPQGYEQPVPITFIL